MASSSEGKNLVRVSARSDAGFHRAGQFWPGAGRVAYVDDATLARLKAEPQLVVEDAELSKLSESERASLEAPAPRGPTSEADLDALNKSAEFPRRRDPQTSANVQRATTTDAHGNTRPVAIGGEAGATPQPIADAGEKPPIGDEPESQNVTASGALTQEHKRRR